MSFFKKFLPLLILGIIVNISLCADDAKQDTKKAAEPTAKDDDTKKDDKKSDDDKKDDKKDDDEKKDDEKKDDDSKPKEEIKPPQIGNFSLPSSQQPASHLGFGFGVIDKGEVEIFCTGNDFVGRHKAIVEFTPGILFGVTDSWSLGFAFPFFTYQKDGHAHSDGLADFFIESDFTFYSKSTYDYAEGATLVADLFFPTGSSLKNPTTGFGAPAFFLGANYTRTWIDWFVVTGVGGLLTWSEHGTKFGDQFVYQFAFGNTIPSPCGWIYAWALQFDGVYSKKNRIDGEIDDNSGGNTFFITPTVSISSREFLMQFGVGVPVNQNLFGHQHKFDYSLNLYLQWSFYQD